MMVADAPEEISIEELKRAWVVKHEQHELHKQITSKQIDDHVEFLSQWQTRLEDWEKRLTKIDNKHHTLQAETGYLGADFGNVQ